MKTDTNSEWKYEGAFVVQFSPETDLNSGRCFGRVEHVASYNAARFCSLDELLEFVGVTLTRVQAQRESADRA